MKRILLLSLLLSSIIMTGFAQELLIVKEKIVERSFSYGPKVGLTLSNLSITEINGVPVDNPLKANFMVGGFVNYRAWGWLGLQAELLYSRQGTALKSGDWKGSIRLDYISVPIMAKVYILDNFCVEAGPQVSFRVDKAFKDDARMLEPLTKFHSADLGIAMGGAYDFPMGITIDVRYVLGLTNAVSDLSGYGLKSKNGVMQISAAWNF